MSSEIKRKEISVGENNDYKKPVSVVYHDFWKEAPEDVLFEIFIRLPDCQSVLRSSSVCRLWHSLIIDNPQFIPRFKSQHHQHQERYPLSYSYTILFRRYEEGTTTFPGVQYYQPISQIFSKEWMFLHGKFSKSNFLDFLPSPMVIRASCNDLLLVSPGSLSANDFYVCNPITKQFVHLPPIPRRMRPPRSWYTCTRVGYGLVCIPTTTIVEFKVVQFISPKVEFHLREGSLTVIMFCSESRKWEKRSFDYPQSMINTMYLSLNVVTCNGILYWLGDNAWSEIVYLDLLKEQCGVVGFLPSYEWHHNQRIGVVCVPGGEPELRLIQVGDPENQCVCLNVWRLNYNNDGDTNWVSVHEKEFICPENLSPGWEYVCRPFLHPTNSNLAFVFWEKTCFQFNLVTATSKKVDGITREENVMDYLPFPLVSSYGASCLANSYC